MMKKLIVFLLLGALLIILPTFAGYRGTGSLSDCYTTYAGKTVCQWRGKTTTYQQYNGYNHYKWW